MMDSRVLGVISRTKQRSMSTNGEREWLISLILLIDHLGCVQWMLVAGEKQGCKLTGPQGLFVSGVFWFLSRAWVHVKPAGGGS